MSVPSSTCRVVKHAPQGVVFRKTTYKKAKLYLLKDFDGRCAYSMEKVQELAEVDHFNPNYKKNRIQEYENLFPSSRHCNGKKSSTWPTKKLQALGIRFLNCSEEMDYGESIFEDPSTNELIGTTPAAKWHIRQLDLNAPHLINKRSHRAALRRHLSQPIIASVNYSDSDEILAAQKSIQKVQAILDDMIPDIPEPPPAENDDQYSAAS